MAALSLLWLASYGMYTNCVCVGLHKLEWLGCARGRGRRRGVQAGGRRACPRSMANCIDAAHASRIMLMQSGPDRSDPSLDEHWAVGLPMAWLAFGVLAAFSG